MFFLHPDEQNNMYVPGLKRGKISHTQNSFLVFLGLSELKIKNGQRTFKEYK